MVIEFQHIGEHSENCIRSRMQPLKLVVIGPVKSGKSTISNFLADATEMFDDHPTQGVRILEFEVQEVETKDKRIPRDIELWDCSGDYKFENCWPVMRNGLHGVILVYSANSKECLKQLHELYNYFVEQTKIGPEGCVIFCFDPEKKNPDISKEISSAFAKVSHVKCNTEEGGSKLKTDFLSFVANLVLKMQRYTEGTKKGSISSSIFLDK